MKKIFTPMLLKLHLALIIMFCASVFDVTGQNTLNLAPLSQNETSLNTNNSSIISDAALNEYSTGSREFNAISRPAVAPFNCDDGFVFIITNRSSANGNVSGLNSFNLSSKAQVKIKEPLIESKTSSQFINGIGYNVVDNYIYGLLQGTNQVTKIDATGNIEFLSVTGDFTAGDYSSGDIDKNGILYLYGKGAFIAIDLNSSSPDYLKGKTLLRESRTFHDMAFSPIDDNLYMITSNSSRTLLRFNTTTNTLTALGNINGLAGETTNSFGTAFMDSLGNMYVSNNASGNIYKIVSPHTGGLIATLYNSLSGTPGDGARCPYQAAPPNAVDDQACAAKDEIITIDLLKNDGEGTYPLDVASVTFTNPATNEKSTTVTVAGQGTFKVDNKGIMTFTPLSSFTEATITYTIIDSTGVLSHQAAITVTLNTTTAPTGDSVQSFCTTDALTISALKVTGSSIKWYASATSTAVLPSSTILEEKTYYASQISSSCESIERLAVTVKISESLSLIGSQNLTCTNSKATYIIRATFNGTAPLVATGNGAPGVFTNNGNKTYNWVSSPIASSLINYNVEISDVNGCNSVVLSGDAPFDCLATPFNCDEGLAFILTNTGTDQNNYVTGLYTLNLATNVQNLVKYPLVEDTSNPNRFINAIGFNIKDNYLYGLLQRTNQIARIDNTGEVEYLTITGAFTPGYYSSGDIDDNGTLYLFSGSKFVSISLDPANADYLVAQNLVNYSSSIHDLAYNNKDNNIYMVTSSLSPNLIRYNIATNNTTNLGKITGLEAETTPAYGTAFMDSMGNLFIANNISGKTYKIASPHTGGTAAVFYSSAMAGLQPGDGARCQNQITLPVANDDTTCGTLDTNTIINVLENDGEGSYKLDISSVRFIDPVTLAPVTSVVIANQGTFTVDANGVVTFSPVGTFTEATVQYFIKDVLANESQLATITVKLNVFEVTCPTFADLSVECYGDLPNQTSYTITEFEALGNGNGRIDDSSCGIIKITAANSADNGNCSQLVTRTYTITEYEDTNNNGILDANETTVLNTTECVQTINVQDTIAPNLVTEYLKELTISCDNIPEVPELVFEDACSNSIEVAFNETSTDTGNSKNYVITRTWTVSDLCENESIHTQIINVNIANPIVAINTELCNDDDFDFDLFSLLTGTYDKDGTWSVVTGNVTLDGSTFNPYQLDLATYTFKYAVADEYCPTETLVNIVLNDDCIPLSCGAENVIISKAVTTHADEKNDFFTISGVDTCGFTYEVQIFNRWGAMIYESKNYQNNWNGTASKASVGSSNYVPTGTYYYVVNLKNSGLKPFAGPLYVATK